ncbi:sigma-54-dependent Fis family transcriptional regulator [Myroides marinus]|uniref:DNA-binding transcriptional response regulator, NtrC family, contains REC, AAA-type ATPase, and a Fis-type DNA-binding domains n=1 Tax=Myroides marinus TaxID=703342 RepID=A0A1H6RKC9_9FLAO|nr:sigma-54 dependent transcriptional regulator [Myroides marinus]MDM1345563.1 sigma-54-dependent Fis family transcriptional regulator [Myroides marinus]MDM1349152.1 sigma-54-dependent Fis family transcriptional regulator [Myroides marinus]MDM1356362.1 sigma-54-dependent Fis family transcriptional regulator [Myroides marinus]MDM1363405.1 sigma-54-dependent Fis family transcriptional regulator [Myroides marinus]MDM1501866.1 sigma-54-dependent Fis family transcriptional regulator [Myroides marin
MRKTNATILVLDDNSEVLIAAKMLLKRHFENIFTNNNPKKLAEILSQQEVDVIILDMNFRVGFEDGKEGIFWFKEIKKISPNTQIILMTSYGNVETAVEGIKLGAVDYILKPWNNESLIETVKGVVKQLRKKETVADRPQKEDNVFIGQAPSIQKVYTMASRVAKTDVNALILGENGTGKYVLAKHIHDNSPRKDQPFIHVDLGSLNENLFESELFGYAKGAFTDAKQDTEGRFEAANGGTIFLDEIGNVPLHLQAKLLQVIQSKSVIRLGESKSRPVDIRIITATNANIEQEVNDKLFREDLYYRINTVTLQLPPLRERQEDILPLLHFFIEEYADKYERSAPTISSSTQQSLTCYDWKGNIREMQNRVERALILTEEDELNLSDFGISPTMINDNVTEENTLQDMERNSILKALEKYDGNISQTAEELGLSRAALYRRLEKYNIKN